MCTVGEKTIVRILSKYNTIHNVLVFYAGWMSNMYSLEIVSREDKRQKHRLLQRNILVSVTTKLKWRLYLRKEHNFLFKWPTMGTGRRGNVFENIVHSTCTNRCFLRWHSISSRTRAVFYKIMCTLYIKVNKIHFNEQQLKKVIHQFHEQINMYH